MLGQHSGYVGVVVLHGDGGHLVFLCQPQGQMGAEKVGVYVVGKGIDGATGLRQQLLYRGL